MNGKHRTPDPTPHRDRWAALRRIEGWLEIPMIVLGLAWLVLLVVELTRGVSPLLETAVTVVWILFILEFLLRFTLAPHKLGFLKGNLLTIVSLAVPALRAFRALQALRVLRATRGLRLIRVVTALNRGMRALGATTGAGGFGYVVALTVAVVLVAAAGMYTFESLPDGDGIASYGEAVWWTAMVITTLGPPSWPQTPEGRILCLLLALYALGVFGYITAMLASFFVGQDVKDLEGDDPTDASLGTLRREIAQLREELRARDAKEREP